MVTGGTTGIGLETARALASAGAAVLLSARGAERGDAAVAAVRETVPDADISFGLLDLEDLDSVRAFAKSVLAERDRIDFLFNNAGIMGGNLARTKQGFERQFGTNHLGHFLLTALLTPALLKAAPARLIVLGSAGHHWSDIVWDDPNFERSSYRKWIAYGQSKTANLLFANEFDRRYGQHGVHAFAVHPGAVSSELGRHVVPEDREELQELVKGLGSYSYKTPAQGASSSVWAASTFELDGQGGAYIVDCSVASEGEPGTLRGYTAYARDPESARRLWDLSEELVGERFPRTLPPYAVFQPRIGDFT